MALRFGLAAAAALGVLLGGLGRTVSGTVLGCVAGDLCSWVAGSFVTGVSRLLSPSLPRFIILAGVTGVRACGEEGKTSCETEEDEGCVGGGAGGGMERSTGEGVSPTGSAAAAAVLLLLSLKYRAGVEVADFEIRDGFFAPVSADTVGECFFEAGLGKMSSLVGDTGRLLLLCWDREGVVTDCWCAPSQGLVSGDRSKSRSAGRAEGKARLAGAEVEPREGKY